MAVHRQLDRFKLSLAIIDVVGVLAFFISMNWLILVYLALFNCLIILIDVVRRGMIVHKPQPDTPTLPDDIPIDPETGNLYTGGFSGAPAKTPTPKVAPVKSTGLRNVPSSTPFARRADDPFEGVEKDAPVQTEPLQKPSNRDPQREDIERTLEEWGGK